MTLRGVSARSMAAQMVRENGKNTMGVTTAARKPPTTTGQMAKFAPKLGNLFLLQANHALMHGGQFSVVRRKLGKPVLF